MDKGLEKYLGEVIQNIRTDRAVTNKLLFDVMNYLKGDETKHLEAGQIAAKYVETLQRSNEQLVKVAAILQKSTNSNAGLSEGDKNEIFDLIKETG